MKIAILHTDFRIYWPPRIIALHAYLMAMGHTLVVIEIAGKGSPYSFAVHTDISDFPSWLILFPDKRIEDISAREAGKAVYQTLDQVNPDVLLSGAIAFYSGATAVKWAGDRDKPLVIFDNARLQDVPRNFLINLVKNQLYQLSDAILCPAPSHATSFKFWGFKIKSIFYGLNCVDHSFFKEQVSQNKTQDNLFKLPERYFLSVGRHIPKKNLGLLLQAYKQYLHSTQDTPIALVIVGDGSQNCLLRLIAGELIDEFIFFLPFLTQEQLVPVYNGSTAYVLPSLFGETWGLTVNEAMACGKPVVVSSECGCSETLVHPGENGWIFGPADQGGLTDILIEIGTMKPCLLLKMGIRSEEIVSDWGIENFIKEIWQSIDYAITRSKLTNKKSLFIPRMLTRLWPGRYRPEMPAKRNEILKIKHLVVLHTDLRIYWRSRLLNLQKVLFKIGIRLDIIEIAGKGSPYAFEKSEPKNEDLNWHILFPEKGAEDVPSSVSQKAISELLKELDPDVVLAGAIAFQSGAGALKWKAVTGKPIIIFDDARPEDVKRNRFVNAIKKIFYHDVDAILCPAPSHSRGFIEWGFKKKEIFYGVDVVDNELFEKIYFNPQKPIETDIIPPPYFLAIGRQIEKKNWTALLSAFIQYKNEYKGSLLNLVFIGDGPLHQSLFNAAERRNDIFFIPFVQQSSIVQYYHQAKGLILPSRYGETWGLVINEAMAAGLPVLVSKECGSAQTLVKEGINGWTFDPNNPEEMYDAISKLDHLSHVQWEKMSQSSIEIIKEWGLPRFSQGVLDALLYISTNRKSRTGWLSKILLKFWNGRYRPV